MNHECVHEHFSPIMLAENELIKDMSGKLNTNLDLIKTKVVSVKLLH